MPMTGSLRYLETMRSFITILFTLGLATRSVADPPVDYLRDVKPLLTRHCVECHGPKEQKGKLRLDTLEAVLKGGQDGKVVEAGASAKSMLVHNVAHIGDEDDYMPPPDNKDKIPPLTKEQIGLIRAWIDQGAK